MPDNELSDFIFASYACAQPTVTLKGAMAVQSSTLAEGKIAVYANSANLPAPSSLSKPTILHEADAACNRSNPVLAH